MILWFESRFRLGARSARGGHSLCTDEGAVTGLCTACRGADPPIDSTVGGDRQPISAKRPLGLLRRQEFVGLLEVASRASKCWSCGGLGSERKSALTASGIRSTQVPPGTDPASQTALQGQKVYPVSAPSPAQAFAFCVVVT
jgi:hypothetical protein